MFKLEICNVQLPVNILSLLCSQIWTSSSVFGILINVRLNEMFKLTSPIWYVRMKNNHQSISNC